jgi:hypothetical protein
MKILNKEDIKDFYEIKLTSFILDKDSCWLYIGILGKQGYGKFTIKSTTIGLHRLSYIYNSDKAIPNNLHVLHKCDIPNCFNPDHLFLGTNQDNIDDKMNKGRHIASIGENNGRSKLSNKEVIDIYSSNNATNESAIKYAIHPSEILRIKNKANWKTLTDSYDLSIGKTEKDFTIFKALKEKGRSKLTAKEVLCIYISQLSVKKLAEQYNLSVSPIRHIQHKRAWKELTDFYDELFLESQYRKLI